METGVNNEKIIEISRKKILLCVSYGKQDIRKIITDIVVSALIKQTREQGEISRA